MKKYFSSYWVRSGFFSFLQRFAVQLFGLFSLMILARLLTAQQMGLWSLFLIFTGFFELAKTSLLKNAHIRYVTVSNDRMEKAVIASSSLLINIILTAVFMLCIFLFANSIIALLKTTTDLFYMLEWFLPGMMLMIFFSHLEAIQQSHLDFHGVFWGYFVRQSVFFGILLFFFITKKPLSLTHLVIYQTISIAAGTLVLYLFTKKYLDNIFRPAKAWIKTITAYGGYIFGSGILSTLFSSVDQLMASIYIKDAAVAYYSIALKVNNIMDTPSFVAADILFPKSSRAISEEGADKVKYLFERMVGILLSFTLPVSILMIIFAHYIIRIIAGPGYELAVFILQMYMAGGILRPLQNQAANLLNSIGKTKLCFLLNVFTVALNIVLNYICFKQFGFYGAAIGTFLTLVITIYIWIYFVKKQVGFELKNIWAHLLLFYKTVWQMRSKLFKKTAQ